MTPLAPGLPPIFLADERKMLLVLHALLAASLLGLVTHGLVWTILAWLRPQGGWARQEGLFAKWMARVFVATYVVGALNYPSYTVFARALVLDHHDPQVSRWFDIKENWMTLALALVVGRAWIRRRVASVTVEVVWPVYLGLTVGAAVLVWGAFVIGIVVVSYASV